MEEIRNAYNILVGKPDGKRPLGRPRRRWEEVDLREIVWEDVDRIHLVRNRDKWRALVNTVTSLRGISWLSE
jgi:cell wall assembly regulator SMI1